MKNEENNTWITNLKVCDYDTTTKDANVNILFGTYEAG